MTEDPSGTKRCLTGYSLTTSITQNHTNCMTFWQKLEKYPPVLVRLLAREHGDAMTDYRIAEAAGGELSLADVKRLSYLTSWDDVPVRRMHGFLIACGVDLSDRETLRNLNRYMKDPKFEHLRRHKDWPQFRELLAIYARTLTQ